MDGPDGADPATSSAPPGLRSWLPTLREANLPTLVERVQAALAGRESNASQILADDDSTALRAKRGGRPRVGVVLGCIARAYRDATNTDYRESCSSSSREPQPVSAEGP